MTIEERQREEKLKKAFDVYESFQSDFDYTSRHTKSYAQRMWEIIEDEKVCYLDHKSGKQITAFIRNRDHFSEVTGLSPSTYDRIKRGSDDWVPSLTTFMTLCMVYQLNITMVKELRRSYGYDFNPRNRVHQAYVYLLVNCRGKSLMYCNKVLKSLKIESKYYLGDKTIDEEVITKETLANE